MNIFKQMSECLNTNARPLDSDLEKLPGFMFCRWLSNHPNTIMMSNQFNLYYKEIPINIQWHVAQTYINGRIRFIKFPSKSKEESSILQKCIMREYKVSLDKAKEYEELLSPKEIEKVKKHERYL